MKVESTTPFVQGMSAAQAAARIGIDRASVVRAIRAGRLTAIKNAWGDYEITEEAIRNYRPHRHKSAPARAPLRILSR